MLTEKERLMGAEFKKRARESEKSKRNEKRKQIRIANAVFRLDRAGKGSVHSVILGVRCPLLDSNCTALRELLFLFSSSRGLPELQQLCHTQDSDDKKVHAKLT